MTRMTNVLYHAAAATTAIAGGNATAAGTILHTRVSIIRISSFVEPI